MLSALLGGATLCISFITTVITHIAKIEVHIDYLMKQLKPN